jgi:hypothetical protein
VGNADAVERAGTAAIYSERRGARAVTTGGRSATQHWQPRSKSQNNQEADMKSRMLNHYALTASVVAALAVGGMAVATPAMAQVGPYYDYAPGYGGAPWGTIIGNSNPSVPFDPGEAALAHRYGRGYGYCGFTIAGC